MGSDGEWVRGIPWDAENTLELDNGNSCTTVITVKTTVGHLGISVG